jgi:hypothetical protein
MNEQHIRLMPPIVGSQCPHCNAGIGVIVRDLDTSPTHLIGGEEMVCLSVNRDRLDDQLYAPQVADEDSLTRRDLLNTLVDDCGEVIHAAMKCTRFGYDRNWPGYGVNHVQLSAKVNDLLAVLQLLRIGNTRGAAERIRRAAFYKQYMRKVDEHGPQPPPGAETGVAP